MIIYHEILPNLSLILRAYTFDNSEYEPLQNVMRRSVGEIPWALISNDSFGRPGREYTIARLLVSKFQSYLGVEFFPEKVVSLDKGQPYRCKELKLGSRAVGCKTFYAEDIDRAKTKCSLVIARAEGWFSGEAEEGECIKKGWW